MQVFERKTSRSTKRNSITMSARRSFVAKNLAWFSQGEDYEQALKEIQNFCKNISVDIFSKITNTTLRLIFVIFAGMALSVWKQEVRGKTLFNTFPCLQSSVFDCEPICLTRTVSNPIRFRALACLSLPNIAF